jgi:protocatechuate 3,4-dioxygenase beta subunit
MGAFDLEEDRPTMTRRSSGAARRPRIIALAISLVLLGAAVALLLVWSGRRHRAGLDPGTEAALPAIDGARPASGESGQDAETALLEGAATEEEKKAEPEVPPLLRGRVTGEGAGIAGAGVHLFSRDLILGTIERLRDAAESGGDMPEIPVLIATVREELDRLKRNDIAATTDGEGIYEFRGISPDSYFVLTLADGWLFRYGDVASVTEGTTATLDLDLERGASIAGRVVGAAGEGLPGITVVAEFRPAGLTGFGRIVHHLLRYVNGEFLRGPFEGKSGEDGSFTIDSLPPGLYDLAAIGADGIESRLQGVETGSTDAVIYLGRGGAARGFAIDGTGLPVAGASFWLERQEDVLQLQGPMMMWSNVVNSFFRLIDDGPRRVRSGPRGEVHVARLGPGSYRLSIDGAGFLPFTRTFGIDWGESVDLGLLRLDRGESIRGAALDEGGSPLGGARVVAAPANVNFLNMANVFDDQVSGRASATADASGAFRLDGLVKGKYRLVASARGYAGAMKIVESGEEAVALHLKRGVRASGLVVAGEGGKPVPGARVRSGTARSTTDEEGRFVLEGVTPRDGDANPFAQLVPVGRTSGQESAPRKARITVSAQGYLAEEVDVEIASLHEEIRITIAKAPEISGRVLDPDGSPAAGSLVRLAPAQETPFDGMVDTSMFFLAASLTDLDGKFRLRNFRHGEEGVRYRIVADHPLYSRGRSESFQLEESDSAKELEIRLERAAKLKGIVTDGTSGVAGASVRLAKATAEGRGNQEFGAFMALMGLPRGGEISHAKKDGAFRFEGVAPGEYTVSAEGAGFTESKEIPVTLAAGDEKEVAITVVRGGELSGVVVDTAGVPLEGAKVRLIREPGEDDQEAQQVVMIQKGFGGSFKSARSASDGSFRFQGLPAGKYTIVASSAGFTPREVEGLDPGKTEHRIVLEPSAVLRGIVRDAANGAPIPRFRVGVSPKDLPETQGGAAARRFLSNERDHADPEGRFTREDLAAGVVVVVVGAAGYVPARAEVVLASGRAVEEEFLLAQAGRIRGRVVDLATQQPISGARVGISAERPSGEEAAAGQGDAAGSGAGGRRRSRIRRADNEDGAVTVGGVDSDDAEEMTEYFMEDLAGERVVTADDGTFLLEDVPVGPQRLVVTHASFVPEAREGLEVAAGEEITAQIALRSGLSLSGRVADGSGKPAAGRFVFLRGTSGENAHVRKSVVSGPDGDFQVGGLEKGTYRVSVAGGREERWGETAPAQSIEVGQDVTGLELAVP